MPMLIKDSQQLKISKVTQLYIGLIKTKEIDHLKTLYNKQEVGQNKKLLIGSTVSWPKT